MIHRGKGLTVGPDPTDGLFSLTSSSLLVQTMPYPPCPPPAAEPHWTKTDHPHRGQPRENRSCTGNWEVAGANESWTRMKERGRGSKGARSEDTVFASCAFGFRMDLWNPGLTPLSGRWRKWGKSLISNTYCDGFKICPWILFSPFERWNLLPLPLTVGCI